MRRGFKARAEDVAVEQRRLLGLRPEDPLPWRLLADYLSALVIAPRDIPGMTDEISHQLISVDSNSWSATTIVHNGQIVIIHNPAHSANRQESNVMHELAHILCRHSPSHIVQSISLPFALRTYDPEQEEEASWLGGCLQLPRIALLWAARQGMSDAMIVRHFGASLKQVQFRRRKTGVDRQISRWVKS